MKLPIHLAPIALALAFLPLAATAQITDEPVLRVVGEAEVVNDPNEPLSFVDQMPEFPGGNEAMMAFMTKNLKYPEDAEEEGIEGKVFLSFVVERDGSLSEVIAIRAPHPSLEREAIRVVRSMPKWTPGKQKGELCRVKYTLPLIFKLTN